MPLVKRTNQIAMNAAQLAPYQAHLYASPSLYLMRQPAYRPNEIVTHRLVFKPENIPKMIIKMSAPMMNSVEAGDSPARIASDVSSCGVVCMVSTCGW